MTMTMTMTMTRMRENPRTWERPSIDPIVHTRPRRFANGHSVRWRIDTGPVFAAAAIPEGDDHGHDRTDWHSFFREHRYYRKDDNDGPIPPTWVEPT